jgi:hypothetical protein
VRALKPYFGQLIDLRLPQLYGYTLGQLFAGFQSSSALRTLAVHTSPAICTDPFGLSANPAVFVPLRHLVLHVTQGVYGSAASRDAFPHLTHLTLLIQGISNSRAWAWHFKNAASLRHFVQYGESAGDWIAAEELPREWVDLETVRYGLLGSEECEWGYRENGGGRTYRERWGGGEGAGEGLRRTFPKLRECVLNDRSGGYRRVL